MVKQDSMDGKAGLYGCESRTLRMVKQDSDSRDVYTETHAVEMKCFRRLFRISDTEHKM